MHVAPDEVPGSPERKCIKLLLESILGFGSSGVTFNVLITTIEFLIREWNLFQSFRYKYVLYRKCLLCQILTLNYLINIYLKNYQIVYDVVNDIVNDVYHVIYNVVDDVVYDVIYDVIYDIVYDVIFYNRVSKKT